MSWIEKIVPKKSGKKIVEKGSGYGLNWKNSDKKNSDKKIVKIVEKGSGYGLNWKNSDKKNSDNSGERGWLRALTHDL